MAETEMMAFTTAYEEALEWRRVLRTEALDTAGGECRKVYAGFMGMEMGAAPRDELWNLQEHYRFPNGYGADAVRHAVSYGRYCEVAVLHNGAITYDTPLTGDVLAVDSREQLEGVLRDIEALT